MRQCPAPPTVLIVDDNELFRRTTGAALRQAGYTVREADNGLSALRHLRCTEPPHLILLDLLMPVMDGWQFRDRLTADPDLCEIPVVVTTAVGQDYQRENPLGAAAYVPKPCPAREVVRAVQAQCPLEAAHFRMQSEHDLRVGAV